MATPNCNQPKTTPPDWFFEKTLSSPTIDNILDEIIDLLGQSVILESPEAKHVLESQFDQISHRDGTDLLEKGEQTFFNLATRLLDAQGKIHHWCLNKLKEVQLESSSLCLAAQETCLFKREIYRISLSQSCHYGHHDSNWILAAHGNLSGDWRATDSTFARLMRPVEKGSSWHILSQDGGKTYRIALATNDFGQKGWFLSPDKEACFVQKPTIKPSTWHLEFNDSAKNYRITVASQDSSIKGGALSFICHDFRPRVLHGIHVADCSSHWRVEPI